MCNGRRETVAMRSPPLTNKQKREEKNYNNKKQINNPTKNNSNQPTN